MKRDTCVWIQWEGRSRQIYVIRNHKTRHTPKAWFSGLLLHGQDDGLEDFPGLKLERNELLLSEAVTEVPIAKVLRESNAAILGGALVSNVPE